MHRRLQFGIRENPASDRRHGSRLGVSTKSSSDNVREDSAKAFPSTPLVETALGEASVSANAAPKQAATAGERGIGSTELKCRYDSSDVERPLTCEEAAAFVRVHPKTVKRMARRGELPGHFRFGRWFFYASELDSWMRTELHSSRHSCR